MDLIGRGKFFSKLRNFHIHDIRNEKIGRVGDLLIRKTDFSVYALISHQGTLKEKLESIGLLNDRDEIIPLHHIDKENIEKNRINTIIEKRKLRTTTSNWEIPDDYFLFSKLCKLNVVDNDGDAVGKITDIIYHEDGDYAIVIDPHSYIQHFFDVLHLRHHHEIIIPGTHIKEIVEEKVQLAIDRQEIEEIDALPIHNLLNKNRSSHNQKINQPKKRYHYNVLQAPIYEVKEKLEAKSEKIANVKSKLAVETFDSKNENQIKEFITLFNEVALTSVDPYEQLTEDKVKTHFTKGTYIAYYLDKPVGYCITSEDSTNKIGGIAGIGVHHKYRGKRFSTVIMENTVKLFDDKGIEFIQCDILVNNESSLGLFHGLGFKEIDDFYLS